MAKKIYIDPGHSQVDPGAVGYEVERDLNEKVSKFMNEYLLANYECETKVDPVSNNSLTAVANAANAWGADLLVSNHFNAGGGDGYEVLIYSEARRELGEIFNKHVKAIGQNSRGVKLRPGLAVLRLSDMPAVLNEGAFVDNLKDIQDWNEDHELKKLGEAYAKAAAEYLNLPKKGSAAKPVETPVVKPVETPVTKPTEKTEEFKSYKVRVTASALNVRKGPGTKYAVATVIRDKGVYTIVEETNDKWGKLKSGAGWISLNYTKKI